jgi:Mn2+/Fe2+ NRAMP family transporter
MESLLSSRVAPAAFGLALLAAGQLSTFTGTIAGQVSVCMATGWASAAHIFSLHPAASAAAGAVQGLSTAAWWKRTMSSCQLYILMLLLPLLWRTQPPSSPLQVVLVGFLNIRLPTWVRRLATRGAAVLPAALLQALGGDRLSYR